ncbi:hypothetical protein BLNAU_14047 [Blattamonas nauphoetae]|uniref:PH domain-containing protein n=1 Tax=Blattamonas nauphoetae TaxID=2049346 RepID=A0ABQ9XHQ4_9EUKA|nr:hypothetical protein BLNAU_14047 [Blattamonas nauphoetae]
MDVSVLKYYTSIVLSKGSNAESHRIKANSLVHCLTDLNSRLIYSSSCRNNLDTVIGLLNDTSSYFERYCSSSGFQKMKESPAAKRSYHTLKERFVEVISRLEKSNESEYRNYVDSLNTLPIPANPDQSNPPSDSFESTHNQLSPPSIPPSSEPSSPPPYPNDSDTSDSDNEQLPPSTEAPNPHNDLSELISEAQHDDTFPEEQDVATAAANDLTRSPVLIDLNQPTDTKQQETLPASDKTSSEPTEADKLMTKVPLPDCFSQAGLAVISHTISCVKNELRRVCKEIPIFEGLLSFRGQVVPQFRPRYALLTHTQLVYFPLNEPISSSLVRTISLKEASISAPLSEDLSVFVLSSPHSVHRSYRIKAESNAIAALWKTQLEQVLEH